MSENSANHTNRAPKRGKTQTTDTAFVGHFFHSFTLETGAIRWQGRVLGTPEPGWYFVQLYDWLVGAPSTCRLVRIDTMESWDFYADADD